MPTAIYNNARSFIYRNARPLDFARWRYFFENGSAQDVLCALAAYQNADGGFGHGLEADCLNPDSTPIQTWSATMILRSIDLYDPEHPIVSGIVRYLESGAAFDGHCWAWSIPSNNDHPHASWWHHQEPDPNAQRNYNPTASLAGWLLRVSGSDFAWRIAHEAVDHYLSSGRCNDMHLLPCILCLYRDIARVAPEEFDISALEEKLRDDITVCLEQTADCWGGYCALPSDYISGREDSFLSCAPELAQKECEYIARTQLPNGAWKVSWNWGGYPEDFAVSANRWQSHIIIKNLLFLRGMGAEL